jgi:hypothetical protein
MTRALSLTSVLVLAACGGGGAQKPPAEPVTNVAPAQAPATASPMSETDRAFAALERFERDMCACQAKDAECAKRVNDDMMKWSQENSENAAKSKPAHMTEEQIDRATKIGTHIGECMLAATGS